jgi:hypothetical protein
MAAAEIADSTALVIISTLVDFCCSHGIAESVTLAAIHYRLDLHLLLQDTDKTAKRTGIRDMMRVRQNSFRSVIERGELFWRVERCS